MYKIIINIKNKNKSPNQTTHINNKYIIRNTNLIIFNLRYIYRSNKHNQSGVVYGSGGKN